MSEKELDEIRKKKLLELQQEAAEEERQVQMEEQLEQKKQALLRGILSIEARQRLTNLKMVKPDFTSQLELQLIQLAQRGQIPVPLTDEKLKQILIQLQGRKREINIRRK